MSHVPNSWGQTLAFGATSRTSHVPNSWGQTLAFGGTSR
jgi:hypothetical protein